MKTFRAFIGALALVMIFLGPAYAVPTSTVTGTVTDAADDPVANGVITFNSLFTQVVSGNTINQTLVSTTTDENGDLTPISLAQGIYIQITINGGAPITAIVPFSSTVTFSSLISNIVTNPSLTAIQLTGDPDAPLCSAGDGTLYFDSDTNQLMLDENCGGYLQVLSAANDFPDCQDAGGNHLNYIASSKMLTCGTSGGGGGGGSNPQTDATAILFNQADNTKLLRLDLSGLTTATTRTLTVPDRNATLATSSGTLTSGNLVKFDASGNVVDNGIAIATLSGNTTKAATVSGVTTNGNAAAWDASGNLVDAGSPAGGKSLLTVSRQTPARASTTYSGLSGNLFTNPSAEIQVQQVIAFAGTLQSMRCASPAAAGAGNTWTMTARKNAVDTTLICTISGASDTTCTSANTVALIAGDLVSLKIVPTSNPDFTDNITCGFEYAS